MKVLIACEESQTVCKAFRAKGHEAYSCDIVLSVFRFWQDRIPDPRGSGESIGGKERWRQN
jgi:hypothetical protein